MKMVLPLPLLVEPSERIRRDLLPGVARGMAIFWGCLFLVATGTRCANPNLDLNLWWIDLRALPSLVAMAYTGVTGLALLIWGIIPRPAYRLTRLTQFCAAIGALVALANACIVIWLYLSHHVHSPFPMPASLIVAASLGLVVWGVERPTNAESKIGFRRLSTLVLGVIGFPILQVFCFGWTNYERPADVAVVFGARAYADGTPSEPLFDRVTRACELYRSGQARRLYFSGGPGDGDIHETESMRRLALQLGVPDSAITADLKGLNSDATVRHSLEYATSIHATTILAVSEFYHLPRIKLCYQGHGAEVYTIPAHPSQGFRPWQAYSILREVPAYWTYFGRAVTHSFSPRTV